MRVRERSVVAITVILGVFTAAVFLPAQENKKEEKTRRDFRVTTLDGVRLVGDFYIPQPKEKAIAPKGKDAPCVILLHGRPADGKQGSRKDWGKLPEKLQAEGFAVLAFDFRGHGDSTNVEKEYWVWNAPRRPVRKPPTKISNRDFRTSRDYIKFGNDLMEAKLFLNRMSDGEQVCNSNNIVIIGAEDGAVMGLLWAAHGFLGYPQRKIDPTSRNQMGIWEGPRLRVDEKQEGEDISCVICLSLQRPSLGTDLVEGHLKIALELLREKEVGVLSLYGQQDTLAKGFWRRAEKWLKPDKKLEYDRHAIKEVEKTKLAGTKLLGNPAFNIEEKFIFPYLAKAKILKDQSWQKKSEMELQQSLFAIDRVLR